MQKRKLGRTNFEVAPIAFGGNVFGWTVDEATSFKLLDAFVGAGFNLIDTADSYSRFAGPPLVGGESETIIGRWIKRRGHHNDVVIATKIGSDMGLGYKCLRADYILKGVEDSLRRLQIETIDLYQSHWDDEKTPVEETLGAYAKLVEQGKVRAIGASNFSVERLTVSLEASKRHGYPRYETLQPLYNLYSRDAFEGPLQDLCVREGISVIPYFALASGFLTGKYRSEADLSDRKRGSLVKKYLNPRGLRILDALDAVSRRHNAKPGQVAIAWLLTRPAVTAPIASATSIQQLDELFAATRINLDAESLQTLEKASAPD
jgi:aryl-alcohol dehydrogenase-like predicted oxidoreductase